MDTLQYRIIKSTAQYNRYCNRLEELIEGGKKARVVQDEIELLTLLIEKYDREHDPCDDADPVELLKGLMKEHGIRSVELARLLQVSEGLVSDMLNYKKGFSKESIRILSDRFKLRQEAFNRPYTLHVPVTPRTVSTRTKKLQRNKKIA